MEIICLLLIDQVTPEKTDGVKALPTPLLITAVIAALLLVVVGLMLWRFMFSREKKFDSGNHFQKTIDVKTGAATERMPDKTVNELDPKTVSSADTVSNQADDAVVDELNRKELSSQPTVDATGDISISNDSEETDDD